MPNLPPKTVVKVGKCSACGTPVEWKLNKNGIAYYYCTAGSTDIGEPCSHHEKLGRANTLKLQRDYLASRAKAAPAPAPAPAADENWLLGG